MSTSPVTTTTVAEESTSSVCTLNLAERLNLDFPSDWHSLPVALIP
jgi:hypothetical protein